ncbi:hypothetical protein HHK36_007387 [Tetracentron sinense]|uniref:Uncharacterized protein n=1 Tax=Tetracentron sinense TaxID=13715 RepID=A0A834ZME1_TETSI|nr:hypothetical protein HHK36_007387 [Tetracentron sinense]
MGRGRVQLKRIENKINRQVTFSKRRTGLLKKAHEISVLCEADVALIIFSPKGKLFQYSTESDMERILQRYEQCSSAERELALTDPKSQGSCSLQYNKLKAKIDVVQRNQRHLMGEEIDYLSFKELHNLEQQLHTSLKHIRSRKNQLMFDSISELKRKVKQLKEKEVVAQQPHRELQKEGQNLLSLPLPSLNIGSDSYQARGTGGDEEGAQPYPQTSAVMPHWMIRHVNQQKREQPILASQQFLMSMHA